MVSPFRGDGPFRGRGPFLGRGPWAGRGPGGFNVGIPFAIDATGEHIRAAISDPTAYASGGYLLRGLGGARLNASARSSVAMQQASDGTYEYAAHNLLLNSATVATQSVTVPSGARVTVSIKGTGSIAISDAATGTLAGTGANNRVSTTVTATTTTLTLTLTGSATEGAVCLGESMVAYVPTGGSAVYAPAVDWLSAQSAYGLRSEAAATNQIRNNTMQGAVVGTLGSGGAAPTNWTVATSMAGVNRTIVGVGTEGGLAYVDVWLNGTPDATGLCAIYPETATGIAATTGQTVTFSLYQRLVGGSLAGLNTPGFVFDENTAAGSYIRNDYFDIAIPTSAPLSTQRQSKTSTLSGGGTVGAVRPYWLVGVTSGVPVDITVRIACPQLETGSRASSPILTLGATATRAADTLVVPGSGWISSTQGTLAADYVPSAAGTQLIAELDDGTANERHSLTNDGIFTVVDGGASQAAVDGGTPTVAARNKIAASYAVDAFAVALNGGAVVTDTSGTLPTVTRMDVNALDGHLTRIRYVGRRLSDGQLRALSV